jgi:hypothetical protein
VSLSFLCFVIIVSWFSVFNPATLLCLSQVRSCLCCLLNIYTQYLMKSTFETIWLIFHRPVGLVELLILYARVQFYMPQASDYCLISKGWLRFLVGQKRSSSSLVILQSRPILPPYFCHVPFMKISTSCLLNSMLFIKYSVLYLRTQTLCHRIEKKINQKFVWLIVASINISRSTVSDCNPLSRGAIFIWYRLWTTVVLFHCCTLIWGLTNNNYNLYFKLLQFMTQCQYTFVLYLHSLAF